VRVDVFRTHVDSDRRVIEKFERRRQAAKQLTTLDILSKFPLASRHSTLSNIVLYALPIRSYD
jgi:hypothetical protein